MQGGYYYFQIKPVGASGWIWVICHSEQRGWVSDSYGADCFPTPEAALADAKAYMDHVVLEKPYKFNPEAFGVAMMGSNKIVYRALDSLKDNFWFSSLK